ncbi:hypothetical protein HYDPIDRAFT_115930 [Hydnomerulius pinastri MD-312]|uniref:Uncharacterized protein n=1 Tax=Hydnomerulius pinastri MD-312 TaxID=994086 RepID=A0A0C9WC88_9AGAM|nr:hypothetical protein HYDPIDRAFT_120492 [Hydnomerulius pinastri MD-312]KIJ61457.1 hypothetical protein HYDPIDRAFT_115930 [Hydnomerulius pinastri MD-312]
MCLPIATTTSLRDQNRSFVAVGPPATRRRELTQSISTAQNKSHFLSMFYKDFAA